MLALNTRKLSTTLFISLAVLVAISTVAEANHGSQLQQREHINLKRIVKKRAPQVIGPDGLPLVIGAAPIPGASSSESVANSTPVSSTTESSTIGSSAASSAASASESASASLSASESASSAASSSISTSSTESSTSSSSATPSPTPTPPPEATPPPSTGAAAQTKSTKTLTKSVVAEQTAVPALTSATAKTQSNVITILVAIVASIGGIFILWTIFRKWKLGSSKRFEQRLQPIDWKNAGHSDNADDGIVPAHRRNSGGSFNSSGHGHSAARNNGLSPLPDHDFTATGASPVGGYADLARGPSPPMRERGHEYGAPMQHSSGHRY